MAGSDVDMNLVSGALEPCLIGSLSVLGFGF